MKDSFDRVLSSRPVNRTAAIVVGSKGDHWNAKVPSYHMHSDTPLPIIPMSKADLMNPEYVDLSGTMYGRLKVIGYYGNKRWVVRCSCGAYEVRRAKAIKSPVKDVFREPMCAKCDYTVKISTASYWKMRDTCQADLTCDQATLGVSLNEPSEFPRSASE
jgi:hypothetical protein